MSNSHKDIEKKRLELQSNLARIQQDLDRSIDEVKDDVSESLSPKEMIRRYPLPALGLSIVAGFLLGNGLTSKGSGSHGSTKEDDVVSSISRSLKKRLAQKAVDTVLDYVEGRLSDNKLPPKSE